MVLVHGASEFCVTTVFRKVTLLEGPDFLSESFEIVFFFLFLAIFDAWGDI